MMNGQRESDRSVVPKRSLNNGCCAFDVWAQSAEKTEGRDLAKGNTRQQTMRRTPSRESMSSALERVRTAAKGNKQLRFTALFHHIYNSEMLSQAYFHLKRQASAGIDGKTWTMYGKNLEQNIRDLSAKLKRGAYRAKPVRRVYIRKTDGRQRPLGVPALEDKIVQRATVEVLNAIYESDFVGFSYGFRPGRSQHDALNALQTGIFAKKVNWVLEADIRGFFDSIDHEKLMQYIEQRIGDPRVTRLIRKWLKAGVLEEGVVSSNEEGTPQGGSASPLLANIFLHYVLDRWIHQWRHERPRGEVIVVRYCDDFVMGFQHKSTAEQCLADLKKRFTGEKLELHPEKTRLLEFGRFAAENRRARGQGKPETFNFLGFTHVCGKARNGRFVLWRLTMRKRLQAKLHEIKAELRRRMHEPIRTTGKWLKSVVTGHYRYYGVPLNWKALRLFENQVKRHWLQALRRRSQKHRTTWERMKVLSARWIPRPQVYHPYPLQVSNVIT